MAFAVVADVGRVLAALASTANVAPVDVVAVACLVSYSSTRVTAMDVQTAVA